VIVSHESIRRQAEQDARDEVAGHKVHNPYEPGSDAHECWRGAYLNACYWYKTQITEESYT